MNLIKCVTQDLHVERLTFEMVYYLFVFISSVSHRSCDGHRASDPESGCRLCGDGPFSLRLTLDMRRGVTVHAAVTCAPC